MADPVTPAIPCPIRAAAIGNPDRSALRDAERVVTYGRLDAMVDSTAASLRESGIAPGDIVAVLGYNSIEYAVLFFAAFRTGYILMPLNCRLTEIDWREQTSSAKCRLLVYDEHHRHAAENVAIASVEIGRIVSPVEASVSGKHTATYALDREALIIFSSGSAGVARGVMLTWGNLYYNALGVNAILDPEPQDAWLAGLPFFHIGGISILWRMALAGGISYVLDRFDAAQAVDAVTDHNIGYISVVPTMLADLLDADDSNILSRCRGIIVGGASWDESLADACIKRRLPTLTTYGLTEASSMVTVLPPGSSPEKLATAGCVLPHREIKIIDENARTLPVGKTGRIAVRGEVLFSRYLGQSEPPVSPDGWFVTGDRGRLDGDSYLTVAGRMDSVIVSGGENIDLAAIERELASLPGVAGAVVLGRRDRRWGQRPTAFVEVSATRMTESSLLDVLSIRLPKIMIPDRIVVVDHLPKTGSGKYDRQILQITYRDLLEPSD